MNCACQECCAGRKHYVTKEEAELAAAKLLRVWIDQCSCCGCYYIRRGIA